MCKVNCCPSGRSPLTWAAYKGFSDTIRLLLVMGAQCSLADKEGCTPLHWAAIRGNADACTVLLQVGNRQALSALNTQAAATLSKCTASAAISFTKRMVFFVLVA